MKEYPVGSVCVIVKAHPSNHNLVGRECTILSGLYEVDNAQQYLVSIQNTDNEWFAPHDYLKLKRFPPETESWCNQVTNKLLSPLPQEEMDKLAKEIMEEVE